MKLPNAEITEHAEHGYYIKHCKVSCTFCNFVNEYPLWLVDMCTGLYCNYCNQKAF